LVLPIQQINLTKYTELVLPIQQINLTKYTELVLPIQQINLTKYTELVLPIQQINLTKYIKSTFQTLKNIKINLISENNLSNSLMKIKIHIAFIAPQNLFQVHATISLHFKTNQMQRFHYTSKPTKCNDFITLQNQPNATISLHFKTNQMQRFNYTSKPTKCSDFQQLSERASGRFNTSIISAN